MDQALRSALIDDRRVAYALLFGSAARGQSTPFSDVDVAVASRKGVRLEAGEIGEITARLEQAVGQRVDLVLLDEASAPLAYRVFREGRLLVENDRAARVERETRAILEYLDFKPVEQMCVRAVLESASDG